MTVGLKDALMGSRSKFRRTKATLPADLAELVGGAEFWIREMDSLKSQEYEAAKYVSVTDDKGVPHVESNFVGDQQRLLVRSLCDADGVPILDDDDAAALGELPQLLVRCLYDQARTFNKLDEESISKNSTTPASSGDTGSAGSSASAT